MKWNATLLFFFSLWIGNLSMKLGVYHFKLLKTRLDLIENELAIRSDFGLTLNQCITSCTEGLRCVSLSYNRTTKSCRHFDVIYDSDEYGNDDYWIVTNGSTRWVPRSCSEVASCSGNTTDGEYWIYPTATNGRRTKIYCHNLDSVPMHYVTLKNTNRFIGHSPTNWVVQQECRSDFKAPLTSVDFVKIQINIEDMKINGTDYTFTSHFGSPLQYGHTTDCNGGASKNPCPRFGNATIDTGGTGLIFDPTSVFGITLGYSAAIKDFSRSSDGTRIFFRCAGWCGNCVPTSGPLQLKHTNEFISAASGMAVICSLR
ncbi:A disintegrin and metalloproteinase with thrombospondin motifs 9-like [Crassostrea virginica]